VIIATAGHVDHGKTLLVKALTGTDTDRLPEEKKRGLTIDLGFAYLPLEDGPTIGFVDVPGHERFIRNMLCGVSGIDFVLFIVAADDGPMPQTEEHLQILDLLGVTDGALAITKIDRVAPDRPFEAAEDFEVLAAGTGLENIPFFPVSAMTGEGIDDLKAHLLEKATGWRPRPATGNFRLPVDRSFTITGAGLVATGTAFSGECRLEDTLRVLPGDIETRLRGLHAQNAENEAGHAGQRLALNLTGPDVSRELIKRGCWVVSGDVPPPMPKFDARLQVLTTERRPLAHWTPVHVHLGAGETTGRVALLDAERIEPGGDALVQIVLDEPLGALHGDRFIIRDQSARRTIGGGSVIDIYPPRRGRAKPERLAFLKAMAAPDHGEALAGLLKIADSGLPLGNFVTCRNLTTSEAGTLFGATEFHRVQAEHGAFGFSKKSWDELRRVILETLKDWHAKNPDHIGPNEDRLLALSGLRLPKGVSAALAAEMASSGEIVRQGTAVRLPSHQPAFKGKDAALWQRIEPYLEQQGLKPPSIHEVAAEMNLKAADVERLMVRAGRTGLVQRISKTRFLTPVALSDLAKLAETVAAEHPEKALDVKAFRDKSEIGRNMTIEVLEYFDKIKFTRRKGEAREILKPADQAVGAGPGA